jgi:hypothetical protein
MIGMNGGNFLSAMAIAGVGRAVMTDGPRARRRGFFRKRTRCFWAIRRAPSWTRLA